MNKMAIGTGSLVLIGVIAIILHVLVLGAVADSENGRSPFTAVPLQDGRNVGMLASGEGRWYKFVRGGTDAAFQRQLDLTLFFTPDNGQRIQHVNFQVFPADQITRWYPGDASQMQNMGAGGIVSRDGNPVTGERLWSGWVLDSDTYYVQVFNGADTTIDYWLFTDNVIAAELGESSALPPVVDVPAGAAPHHPLTLAPHLQKGQLKAGQETWYTIVYDDFDDDFYEPHTFTLIFTPDDGQRVHWVGFEIFPSDQLHIWQRGDTPQMHNLGAGSVVSRDGDPLTGERLWSGWLMDGETYYLKVRNDAEVPIDYWLFPGDIIQAELGEPSPPSPPSVVAIGTDPNHPLPLAMGLNRGGLSPGQERWFSVTSANLDDEVFEQLTLSLFFTADDGQRIPRVNLDIFPAGQLHIWQRGDADQMRTVGSGSLVSRDDDPNTGELLWSGWLIDGETYYVRLRNDANVPINYWLFTADVIRPELGELLTPES